MHRPHGVMFHHFCDDRHPRGQGAISADELERIIHFLGPQRIISARRWLDLAARNALPSDALCLTFDDNLRCQFDVARPVLDRHGIRAFFFVYSSVLEGKVEKLEIYRYFRTTSFGGVGEFYRAFWEAVRQGDSGEVVQARLRDFRPAEYLAGFPFYSDEDRTFRFVRDEVLGPQRYCAVMDEMICQGGVDMTAWAKLLWMDTACLKQLHADGHLIGLHSHNHPTRLERLDPVEQEREYVNNHACLTRIIGQEPVAMSHPCNSYNQTTLEILRRLGVRLGFRANMAQDRTSELEFPREDHANVLRMMNS